MRRLIVRDDAGSVSGWQLALIVGGGICGALAYTWSDTFWFILLAIVVLAAVTGALRGIVAQIGAIAALLAGRIRRGPKGLWQSIR